MKHSDRGWLRGRFVGGALVLAALAACGGGDGDQSPKFQPSKIVSFGDSLSDVGSYNTAGMIGTINATSGTTGTTNSGKFTVNGASAKNWIELLAAQFDVAAPCPAQTGLTPPTGSPLATFAATPTDHTECFAYGQGGARVTNPVGPGNANLGVATGGALGQLTTPLVTQVTKHLAKSTTGKFAGDELVLVLAGGNDLFINAALVGAGQITGAQAIGLMQTAGTELAALVTTQMVAKNAQHVVVVNLPDVSLTPGFVDTPSQGFALQLTQAFNTTLAAGLANAGSAVIQVDAFTQSQAQAASPAQFGLTDVKHRACDKTKLLFDSSLVCNASKLTTGLGDTATFLYADDVHPTPYGYKLLAQFVTDRLVKAGLL